MQLEKERVSVSVVEISYNEQYINIRFIL